MASLKDEMNRMLTEAMTSMRTTGQQMCFCCKMMARMDKRDEELRRVQG